MLGSGVTSRLALLLILAPLMGLAAVVLAEAVPDTLISERLLEARAAETLGAREYSRSPLDTTTVHHSECVAFSVGLGDAPGADPVTAALESRTYRTCPNLDQQLIEFEATGTLQPGTPYLRYWHGYSPLTRSALALFGVAGTRWIVFGLLMAAMGALYVGVKQRGSSTSALLLVAPTLLTTDAIIGGLSIMQALAIGTAWLGGLLCFHLVRRNPTWVVAALAGGLAGAVASYLDLLTTMPGALTMSVVGATLGAGSLVVRSATSGWRIPLAATGGWFIGMAWMWGSKWLLSMLALDTSDVIENITGQIAFRLSGSHDRVDPSRFVGLTENMSFWWDRPLTPLVVLASLVALVVLAVRRSQSIDRRAAGSIALVAAIIVVPHALWYVLLNSHSQIHVAIVYRSLAIAFGGLVAWGFTAIADASDSRRSEPVSESQRHPPT